MTNGGGRVRRPAGDGTVDVAYVRPAPDRGIPLVVLPGGPGLASVLPYRLHRKDAVRRGFDVVMMEHRGIGLSRTGPGGGDIPPETVSVTAAADDLAAVLDDAGLDNAVIYGTSYGTYLAQVFGARHPERVAGMVLDSPVLSGADDVHAIRAHVRRLLWQGPGDAARAARDLLGAGIVPVSEVGHVGRIAYEFAGEDAVVRLFRDRLAGRSRRVWDRLAHLGEGEVDGPGRRMMFELDLVRGITYGELGFAHAPDGLPFDPREEFVREGTPPFTGDPVDLPAALPAFTWPTAVISGERDLRTPRPIAERIVDLAPNAVLVPLADTGHSALDTHRLAGYAVARAVAEENHRVLPEWAGELAGLPRRGVSRHLGSVIRWGLAADRVLPG